MRIPKRIAGQTIWTSLKLLRAVAPEQHIISWISERLRRGGTFYDVGAHYGWMSIVAANVVGPYGHVISFEPSPALVDVLSYHKHVNRLNQIRVIPEAVSDEDSATTTFYLVNDGRSFRNSLTIGPDDTPYIEPAEKKRIEVRSTTLDGFCFGSGVIPDLIKIDVEGGELLVLRGAERLLKAYHPELIVGLHPYWLPRSQSAEQIFDLLEQHKYRIVKRHVIEFDNSYLADYLCI